MASGPRASASLARALRDGHARLGRHLPGSLFADPALMILLDLYDAADAGAELTVGACCLSAGVPHTTALRWLRALERAGLVARRLNPEDARSSIVRLEAQARAALAAWLEELAARIMPSPC